MAQATIILQVQEPVICSANASEMRPGDTVRLHLDSENVPGLPEMITGTVQTPVTPARVIDEETGCPVMGRSYTVLYETDDLEEALVLLRESDVLSLECLTCCVILSERLDAETAARTADDATIQNNLDQEVASRAANDAAEAVARAAADTALAAADAAEAATRAAADTALAAADTALAAADTAEAAARIAADQLLVPRSLSDPTEIDAGFLPSTQEIDYLVMSDTTEEAPIPNALGRSGNQLTLSGEVYRPVDPFAAKGSRVLLSAAFAAADLVFNMATFTLPASSYVIGKRFRITGIVGVACSGNRPDAIYVGLNNDYSFDLTGFGVLTGYDLTGATISLAEFYVSWEFEWIDGAEPGTVDLQMYVTSARELKRTGATTSVSVLDNVDVYTPIPVVAIENTAQDLHVQIQVGQDADGANIGTYWDLKFEDTTP